MSNTMSLNGGADASSILPVGITQRSSPSNTARWTCAISLVIATLLFFGLAITTIFLAAGYWNDTASLPDRSGMSFYHGEMIPLTNAPPHPRYRLLEYHDDDPGTKPIRAVLFIHGNAGSHWQVRSLAARARRLISSGDSSSDEEALPIWLRFPRRLFTRPRSPNPSPSTTSSPSPQLFSSPIEYSYRFFSVDFQEELSALSGPRMKNQMDYVHQVIQFLTNPQQTSSQSSSSSSSPSRLRPLSRIASLVIIGHSMGGIVASSALSSFLPLVRQASTPSSTPSSNPPLSDLSLSSPPTFPSASPPFDLLVLVGTPLKPIVETDPIMSEIYNEAHSAIRRLALPSSSPSSSPFNCRCSSSLLILSGGSRDLQSPGHLSADSSILSSSSDPESSPCTERCLASSLYNTPSLSHVQSTLDHQALMWNHQLVQVLANIVVYTPPHSSPSSSLSSSRLLKRNHWVDNYTPLSAFLTNPSVSAFEPIASHLLSSPSFSSSPYLPSTIASFSLTCDSLLSKLPQTQATIKSVSNLPPSSSSSSSSTIDEGRFLTLDIPIQLSYSIQPQPTDESAQSSPSPTYYFQVTEPNKGSQLTSSSPPSPQHYLTLSSVVPIYHASLCSIHSDTTTHCSPIPRSKLTPLILPQATRQGFELKDPINANRPSFATLALIPLTLSRAHQSARPTSSSPSPSPSRSHFASSFVRIKLHRRDVLSLSTDSSVSSAYTYSTTTQPSSSTPSCSPSLTLSPPVWGHLLSYQAESLPFLTSLPPNSPPLLSPKPQSISAHVLHWGSLPFRGTLIRSSDSAIPTSSSSSSPSSSRSSHPSPSPSSPSDFICDALKRAENGFVLPLDSVSFVYTYAYPTNQGSIAPSSLPPPSSALPPSSLLLDSGLAAIHSPAISSCPHPALSLLDNTNSPPYLIDSFPSHSSHPSSSSSLYTPVDHFTHQHSTIVPRSFPLSLSVPTSLTSGLDQLVSPLPSHPPSSPSSTSPSPSFSPSCLSVIPLTLSASSYANRSLIVLTLSAPSSSSHAPIPPTHPTLTPSVPSSHSSPHSRQLFILPSLALTFSASLLSSLPNLLHQTFLSLFFIVFIRILFRLRYHNSIPCPTSSQPSSSNTLQPLTSTQCNDPSSTIPPCNHQCTATSTFSRLTPPLVCPASLYRFDHRVNRSLLSTIEWLLFTRIFRILLVSPSLFAGGDGPFGLSARLSAFTQTVTNLISRIRGIKSPSSSTPHIDYHSVPNSENPSSTDNLTLHSTPLRTAHYKDQAEHSSTSNSLPSRLRSWAVSILSYLPLYALLRLPIVCLVFITSSLIKDLTLVSLADVSSISSIKAGVTTLNLSSYPLHIHLLNYVHSALLSVPQFPLFLPFVSSMSSQPNLVIIQSSPFNQVFLTILSQLLVWISSFGLALAFEQLVLLSVKVLFSIAHLCAKLWLSCHYVLTRRPGLASLSLPFPLLSSSSSLVSTTISIVLQSLAAFALGHGLIFLVACVLLVFNDNTAETSSLILHHFLLHPSLIVSTPSLLLVTTLILAFTAIVFLFTGTHTPLPPHHETGSSLSTPSLPNDSSPKSNPTSHFSRPSLSTMLTTCTPSASTVTWSLVSLGSCLLLLLPYITWVPSLPWHLSGFMVETHHLSRKPELSLAPCNGVTCQHVFANLPSLPFSIPRMLMLRSEVILLPTPSSYLLVSLYLLILGLCALSLLRRNNTEVNSHRGGEPRLPLTSLASTLSSMTPSHLLSNPSIQVPEHSVLLPVSPSPLSSQGIVHPTLSQPIAIDKTRHYRPPPSLLANKPLLLHACLLVILLLYAILPPGPSLLGVKCILALTLIDHVFMDLVPMISTSKWFSSMTAMKRE